VTAAIAPEVETRPPPERGRVGAGVIVGIVCGAVAIGAAQLVAGLVDPQASPIVAVGGAVVDASPEWLKGFAIRTFGSNDKTVLLVGIGLVLALIAALVGIAALRRPRVGYLALAVFAAIGVAAALTRPAARPADALPALVGGIAGAVMLRAFLRLVEPPSSDAGRDPTAPSGIDRRRLLLTGAAGAVAAFAAGGAGRWFARRFEADASRAAVRLPSPVAPPASPPPDLDVPGISSFLTPNDEFYRVDTALLVPAIKAEEWRLRVHGMVERELTLTFDDLIARPLIERDITLACVSNPVGGEYVGNARWLGTSLADLLREAGVDPSADQLVSRSVDGFTIGTPTAAVLDGRDAMLAIGMNGEPLPLSHGFPVRMVVPGLYGYVSAMKWIVELELSRFDAFDAYWVQRGWAQEAPVKTQSRIDTPRSGATVRAGAVPVAGVAWAQHTGIVAVELRVDGGPWTPAELSEQDTVDTWRQWLVRWDATPGDHQLEVRATDRSGIVQPSEISPPFPDGATGHHAIVVRIT
jgi:DMSO/TMAO reductase YedYZ molybdopterin-dependent catalytic subunit